MLRSTLLLVFIIWVAGSATAMPIDVLLYPQGARITEESSLVAQQGQVTFTLPAAADPNSLQLANTNAAKILSLQAESALLTPAELPQLRQQLEEKQAQRNLLADQLQNTRLGLDYWTNQKTQKLTSSEEIQALGKMIVQASKPLLEDKTRLEQELAILDKEIEELQRKLAQLGGAASRNWRISVTTNAPEGQQLTLRYSYRISSSGWDSSYRLNAQPDQDRVSWSWQAHIQQASGQNWNQVSLRLATREPRMTLNPPELSPWVIRERSEPIPLQSSRKMVQSDALLLAEAAPAALAGSAAVEQTEGQLFDIYELGQHSIPAGQSVTLTIREGIWPASFSYLLRPQFSAQTFLTAQVTPAQQLDLPGGAATLLVDDVLIGKDNFSMHGKEQTIAFGSDPAITSTIRRTDTAAEGGLFNKTRSFEWRMSVSLTNGKKRPVKITIEDSYPRAADKKIELVELKQDAAVQMTKEKDLYQGTVTLAAGEQMDFSYGFRISHPEEMKVIINR